MTTKVGVNYGGMTGPTDLPLRSKCAKCGHIQWADDVVNQDAHDGAALRRLREALPDDTRIEMWSMKWPTGMDAWSITVIGDGFDSPPIDVSGDTIAEAADKCREALKA